ncbi:hypothetical protein A221_20280 [Pseudomonas syringae pv. actinidiae ICMP 18801]|nr:hypothetical protein A3SM_24510 [Pseudomonas syringae pv. actinidiae ICMP 18886]EPN66593.1 hypothetical protein A235_11043 [Pseudomonas syringae pv. actinidiae ICMP 19079]EPN69243.1 hypothetical protein A234_24765 [Pseudomonas syringae pv. actinidiae ICMP 19101]EPN77821.1 hypothetical protein A221_20280 [Pseudomonas syringae pv. actinidiae ICMP 18801]EPN78859.1 hypothetical protein A233_08238 [Pseudomonas syringae pv. actinidiae ICMP 19097]OSO26976.1 hypothetical protein BV361_04312 [Pseudo
MFFYLNFLILKYTIFNAKRGLLMNDEYEVLNFETEQEAKAYIRRVLWESLDEKI